MTMEPQKIQIQELRPTDFEASLSIAKIEYRYDLPAGQRLWDVNPKRHSLSNADSILTPSNQLQRVGFPSREAEITKTGLSVPPTTSI